MKSKFITIMLTREQIEEIQAESREKGVTIKSLLQSRDISLNQYFWWKKKYAKSEVPEGFLPIGSNSLPAVAGVIPTAAVSNRKSKADPAGENWMTIELRTGTGTDMRIQGGLTPVMIYTILKSV